MKIAVVGRGSIGLTCAYELAKSSNAYVTVIGSRSNSFTASRAAGAMLNIVSEVDTFNFTHPLTSWKLANKKNVLHLWKHLMQRLLDDSVINKSLLRGKGTEIIYDANSANEVEKRSYSSMKNIYITQNDNKKTDAYINSSTLINGDAFLIEDEPSVDSQAFLNGLEKYLDTFAQNINDDVLRIRKYNNQWILDIADGKSYKFDYVILCAGSWTESIIDRSSDLTSPPRKSFFGVVSALLASSELEYVKSPTVDRILRTPNRGGTCGIHAVQREENLYVGASSVISNIQLKYARASSVLALLEGLKKTLGLDIYQLSTEVITGYRPVTDDTIPIIGNLEDGLFCCYGTKRDGFTWAPFYAKHISRVALDPTYSSPEWDELLHQCSPHRGLTSAGDVDLCIENYVMNKIFEAHQHDKELTKQEVNSLYSIANNVHTYVGKAEGKSVGVQPELVNMFNYVIMGKG